MYEYMVITYRKSNDQPGKVANAARGQLNRENYFFLSPFAPEKLVSRDGFGSLLKKNQNTPRPSEHPPVMGEKVPKRLGGIKGLHCVRLLISILKLNLALTYGIPPDFRGGVHILI